MKKIIFLVVILAITALTGCAPFFGNSKQWDEEDWYFYASPDAIARLKQDKLALEKLKAQPAQVKIENGAPQGFRGIVANMSANNRYTFKIDGPENKSYYLGPEMRVVDYLLPGAYTVAIYRGNGLVQPPLLFKVGPGQHYFLNENFHWFCYAEW
jgi:hypothetical protein